MWSADSSWTLDHELKAVAIERGELWWSLLVATSGAKADRLPPRIRITHPHRPVERPKPITDTDQIRRFFSGMKG